MLHDYVAPSTETFDEIALLYLDLDRFKPINDTFGHGVGDSVLRIVTDRIEQIIRPHDILARLGGDEFALLQTMGAQPSGARTLARRIIEAVSKPILVDGHTVGVGISIGVAVAPFDAETSASLVQAADLAMYDAKKAGRSQVRFFEPRMNERLQQRRCIEAELATAIEENQFELAYQPVKDVVSDRVVAVEALVRWNHPTLGRVSPERFIPVAEESGLIVRLGEWVLRQACRDATGWSRDTRVAVNVSAVQLRQRQFVATVANALVDAGLPAERLELEVTETALIADAELTVAILTELRSHGVRIALDDFGTGYSSINYLRRFPFDKIKIDRSFVSGIEQNSESMALVRMIAALGTSLSVATTAEGVETEDELDVVRKAGCSQIQGYLLSKPVDIDELQKVFQSLQSEAHQKASSNV